MCFIYLRLEAAAGGGVGGEDDGNLVDRTAPFRDKRRRTKCDCHLAHGLKTVGNEVTKRSIATALLL